MPPKILLADDSVTVQKVIELTFADEGMQVVAVGDGQQAIDRLASDPPDIVLADVSMPERDGYAVAEFIKGTPEYRHIPVVLMTGAFEQLDEGRARSVGCDGVLAKPFEPQMVITLVRQLLARAAGSPTAAGGTAVVAADGYPFGPVAGLARTTPTLDDVFDDIDEATEAAPPPASPAVFAAEGDADTLVTTPPPPVVVPAAAEAVTALSEEPAQAIAGQPESDPGSPLANAFSAILADELGEAPLPASWTGLGDAVPPPAGPAATPAAPPAITDEFVDQVARRVVEHLSRGLVREVVDERVIDVAERLVREEIERLKAGV